MNLNRPSFSIFRSFYQQWVPFHDTSVLFRPLHVLMFTLGVLLSIILIMGSSVIGFWLIDWKILCLKTQVPRVQGGILKCLVLLTNRPKTPKIFNYIKQRQPANPIWEAGTRKCVSFLPNKSPYWFSSFSISTKPNPTLTCLQVEQVVLEEM